MNRCSRNGLSCTSHGNGSGSPRRGAFHTAGRVGRAGCRRPGTQFSGWGEPLGPRRLRKTSWGLALVGEIGPGVVLCTGTLFTIGRAQYANALQSDGSNRRKGGLLSESFGGRGGKCGLLVGADFFNPTRRTRRLQKALLSLMRALFLDRGCFGSAWMDGGFKGMSSGTEAGEGIHGCTRLSMVRYGPAFSGHGYRRAMVID